MPRKFSRNIVIMGALAIALTLILSGLIVGASACSNGCVSDCKSKFPSWIPDLVKNAVCNALCKKVNNLDVYVRPKKKGVVDITKTNSWSIKVEKLECSSLWPPNCEWKVIWNKKWDERASTSTDDHYSTWGVWKDVNVNLVGYRASAYHHTYVDMHPRPKSGWAFDHWEGACSGTGDCSLNIDSNKKATAKFWKVQEFKLYVQDRGGSSIGCKVTLNFDPPRGAHNAPDPDGTYGNNWGATLYKGTWVTPTPTDCSGYRFDHWELSGSSWSGGRFKIKGKDVTLTAVYVKTWKIDVKIGNEDGNSLSGCYVTADKEDNHGNKKAYHGDTLEYDEGTTVTLSPHTPCGSRVFDHWGTWNGVTNGDCTGTGDCTLTMNGNKGAAAFFWKVVDVKVEVVDQDGSSMPSSCKVKLEFTSPKNAEQAPDYTGQYADGSTLSDVYKYTEIKASPLSCSGYRFDHWELEGASGNPGAGITVGDSDVTIKAVYWKQVTLDFDIEDDLGGAVGASLHLTFAPPEGADPIYTPMDGDYDNTDTITMDIGTHVSASPNFYSDHRFDHWTGPCSGTGACSFTMNGDKTLGAVYWKLVKLDVKVKDELGSSTGCTVHLDFTPPASAQNNPADPDGDYNDGDSVKGLYRGTEVSPSYYSCSGYRFDHWELDGAKWSGSSFTMDKDRTIKAVYWKQYTLTIKVAPTTAGDTHTYHVGTYKVDRGRIISLNPTANAGFEFDYWELDGANKGSGITLTFTMDKDHEVVAHFKKKESPPPTPAVPVAAPTYEGCILPLGFPKDMKYRGMYQDLQFNQDLLSRLAGKAGAEEKKKVIVLGGPNVIPYPWEQYEVYFEDSTLKVKDHTYTAVYGEKDYGTILFECDNMVVRVAGINRFGTRAALMWLLHHPDKASGKLLIVVEWVDANHDHQVQDEEITVVYEVP